MIASHELNRESGVHLYLQIADYLRAEIRRGTYQPGKHLPSESQIGRAFRVSDRTARQAVRVLVDEGLATVIRAKGAYVADPLPRAKAS